MRFPSILTLAVVAASQLAGQQRFTGRIAAVVESLGVAAAARGLPVDPVIEKAIEGSAKGIPAERVTAALRVIVDQLDTAAASLRDGGISGDTIAIAAGEFAITAGLRGRDITELARTGRPAADVTVGLRVAGTLAALGVPRPESVKLVSTELRLGRPPDRTTWPVIAPAALLARFHQAWSARVCSPVCAVVPFLMGASECLRDGVPDGAARRRPVPAEKPGDRS